jgi:prepilin-type N-terminal cleavage/methylation domain-containing protein
MKRKMRGPSTYLKGTCGNGPSGFTLFEVILVLILVAVLTAVVLARNSGFAAQAKLRGQADLLKSQLRYAQSRALNATQVWGMKAQNNSLWLYNGGDDTQQVTLPGEKTTPVAYNAGDLRGLTLTDFTVSFDDLGQPYNSDDGSANSLAASLSITISNANGGTPITISITPNTGFIQ